MNSPPCLSPSMGSLVQVHTISWTSDCGAAQQGAEDQECGSSGLPLASCTALCHQHFTSAHNRLQHTALGLAAGADDRCKIAHTQLLH